MIAFGCIESFVVISDIVDDYVIVFLEFVDGAEEGTQFVLTSNVLFSIDLGSEFFSGASVA